MQLEMGGALKLVWGHLTADVVIYRSQWDMLHKGDVWKRLVLCCSPGYFVLSGGIERRSMNMLQELNQSTARFLKGTPRPDNMLRFIYINALYRLRQFIGLLDGRP
jgi:hypothetical protein